MKRGGARVGEISIDAVTFDGALERIAELVDHGAGGAVFTPNVDHVVKADANEAFRLAYARADLCLADGMWILWGARFLGASPQGSGVGSYRPSGDPGSGERVAGLHPRWGPGVPQRRASTWPTSLGSESLDGTRLSWTWTVLQPTKMASSRASRRPSRSSC